MGRDIAVCDDIVALAETLSEEEPPAPHALALLLDNAMAQAKVGHIDRDPFSSFVRLACLPWLPILHVPSVCLLA